MMSVLRTDRLTLRPSRADDLDALHELWTEAGVRQFLFDGRIVSPEEARSFVAASEASFASKGYGLWLFHERGADSAAGFAGLLTSPDGQPGLIFGTRPELWGRGYAAEAAREVLRYAFETAGLERMAADVDEPNQASVRVLEKLGMKRTGRATVGGRTLLYYEIVAPGAGAADAGQLAPA